MSLQVNKRPYLLKLNKKFMKHTIYKTGEIIIQEIKPTLM